MTDEILSHHPSDDPAALRKQNRTLSETLQDALDALRAVRAYAEECRTRPGAIDCLTISATLHGFLTGRELGPDPKIRARVALLEDAISRDDHPALVRHHVDRLAVALRERGVA